jgi:two-component system, sensor histidine kinase LadS
LFTLLLAAAQTVSLAQGEKVLVLQPEDDENLYYPISDYLSVLPDPDGNLKIEDVSGPTPIIHCCTSSFNGKFESNKNQWLSSDIKTHWLRLVVKSDLSIDKQLLAYIQGSVVDLYERDRPGHFTSKHTGLLVPLSERDQKNRFGHLPYTSIVIPKGVTQTFYWRVDTHNFPAVSPHTNQEASIASYEYVLQKNHKYFFVFISICSILFGLALYHLIILVITRDKAYWFFTLYSLFACLYIMYFKGYLLELVLPEYPAIHYSFGFAFTCIAFHVALLIYVREYVNLPKVSPVWNKILIGSFSVIVLLIAVSAFITTHFLSVLITPALWVPMILLEALGFVLLKEKHPLAKIYLAAFTLLVVGFIGNGIFTLLGVEQGIWDLGDLGLLGLQVLLAVGLALRINLLDKEKNSAHVALITQLEENQLLQLKVTLELESKVAERTTEIEEQNEKLSRLNILKDKLFSIISHDIKGPLNQLSSTLHMMERDMITKEEIRVLVPQIRTNLSNNTNFINELLTWAKSQLEGAQLNPQPANLQELIDSNFQLLKPIADAKQIKLTSHLDSSLKIYADVEMIKSVVRNLSANAIKFSNPKGVIDITVGIDKSFASVSVQDNGKGISSENQKKLFGTQIFTTPGTANESGTGIGLLLCKDFVEKNGGKIWVESEEGKGSKFAFTVPLHKN